MNDPSGPPRPRDALASFALTQEAELAIIDDRPGGTIRQITWGELHRYTNRIANGLLRLGVQPLGRVAWCGQNSIETIAITHVGRRLGVITVPVSYRLTAEELVYQIAHSDSTVVWTDGERAPLLAEVRDQIPRVKEVVVFDGEPLLGQMAEEDFLGGDEDPAVEPPREELPAIIYTSGTTGRPRGALRRGNGDPQQRAAMMEIIGFAHGDVYITTGPLYHNGPNNFAMINMGLGNTVVVQRHFEAEDWLRLVEKYRVSSTFSAPTPIRRVCSLPPEVKERYDRSSMRIMLANAAPWPFALKQAYVEDFPPESLWEGYGATEIGIVTLLPPADQLRKPGSCGKAAPFVDIRLVDEQGEVITEPHVPGELYVRSSAVVEGYYKDQEAFDLDQQGEFHTVGDVAYVDEEGYYYICDRKRDMIVSGGVNIYPAEIENVLETHPDVYEAAVFGIPDDEWGESVHAVVISKSGRLTVDDVVAHARLHLAGYKVPRSVTFADDLPRTGSGKILKRELRAPYWEGLTRQV